MAIYTSGLLNNGGLPVSGATEGAVSSYTAKIVIPAGVAAANADIFRFMRVDPTRARIIRVRFENDQLDSSTGITATGGVTALRAVRDPRKAFNATTNPYITGSLSADRSVSFIAAATMQTNLRAAGRSIANEVPAGAKLAELDGVYDLGFAITAAPTTAVTTARELIVTIEYTAPSRTLGEFSGANVYDYQDNSSGI
jgi:hypothetical protein